MREAVDAPGRNIGQKDETTTGAATELYDLIPARKVRPLGYAVTNPSAVILKLSVSSVEVRHNRSVTICRDDGKSLKSTRFIRPRRCRPVIAWRRRSNGWLLRRHTQYKHVTIVVERPRFKPGEKALSEQRIARRRRDAGGHIGQPMTPDL